MPVGGRKPKPPGQAVNRHRPVHEWVEVADVPFVGGPKLPVRRWNGMGWSKSIRVKWDAWRSMPHCIMWGASAWDFALDSIQLAAQVQDGASSLAPELRAREKVMGTTPDFLRDLRIRYVEAPAVGVEESAGVTNIADYRDL